MDISVDFNRISDWNSFHEVFSEVMGFPDFYGKNNNAWIDCMSYIDDKDAGMSKVTVKSGESLTITVSGTEKATNSAAEVFLGFMEIVAAVNQRFIEVGSETRLGVVAI